MRSEKAPLAEVAMPQPTLLANAFAATLSLLAYRTLRGLTERNLFSSKISPLDLSPGIRPRLVHSAFPVTPGAEDRLCCSLCIV